MQSEGYLMFLRTKKTENLSNCYSISKCLFFGQCRRSQMCARATKQKNSGASTETAEQDKINTENIPSQMMFRRVPVSCLDLFCCSSLPLPLSLSTSPSASWCSLMFFVVHLGHLAGFFIFFDFANLCTDCTFYVFVIFFFCSWFEMRRG